MSRISQPANTDEPVAAWGRNEKILEWLFRLTHADMPLDALTQPFDRQKKTSVDLGAFYAPDDWQTIANLCGHSINDFIAAGASLPLTMAEVDHFRRNHRGTENHISRDFMVAKTDLPSPLAELYGLYLHRARIDCEAALFVAQSTGSTRVARIMGDMLAMGGFANGLEYITYLGLTYSVPAAFDTSDVIDRANHEAARRLALSADHPAHLLKLTPDEIGVLAANIVEQNAISTVDFLEKANLLAEARQDVTRLPTDRHLATAITEGDLPGHYLWVARLCAAYGRIFESWVAGMPEIEAIIGNDLFSA